MKKLLLAGAFLAGSAGLVGGAELIHLSLDNMAESKENVNGHLVADAETLVEEATGELLLGILVTGVSVATPLFASLKYREDAR